MCDAYCFKICYNHKGKNYVERKCSTHDFDKCSGRRLTSHDSVSVCVLTGDYKVKFIENDKYKNKSCKKEVEGIILL